MDLTRSDTFWLGLFLGVIAAGFIGFVAHVLAWYLIAAAVVFAAFLLGRRALQRKFRLF